MHWRIGHRITVRDLFYVVVLVDSTTIRVIISKPPGVHPLSQNDIKRELSHFRNPALRLIVTFGSYSASVCECALIRCVFQRDGDQACFKCPDILQAMH